jgi:aspartyl-tRNA(Asn)/glutamyl-tRNA(Gln) amidotransferase subunit A
MAARQADKACSQGKPLGLLHGVPVLVKDNIETAGIKTTYGSGFFRDHVPSSDAIVIKRLRNAGAIIVGKVTLHEFAFGVRSNNPVIGQCRNPWSLDRIPGGSSGGSGVAIATGMAPLTLGTDTGGSVRIPAALNGITGLRPTVERVSNHGCMPVSPTFDTIGPMGVSVTDVARLFTVMSGFDPLDPASENRQLENILVDMHRPITGLRIGIPENHYFEGISADVSNAVESAICLLKSLGAKTYPVRLPGAESAHADATAMIYSDACSIHQDRLKSLSDNSLPATYERSLFEATRAVTQNTYTGAIGRLPGLSLPCGLSKEGMPIGVMLEAAPWAESVLFRVGTIFQKATDWHTKKPSLPAV